MKLSSFTKLRLPVLIAFCLIYTHAAAKKIDSRGEPQEKEYTACITNAQGVTPEIISCTQNEIERYKNNIANQIDASAEDELTGVLKKLVSRNSRLWLAYIEEKCAVYDEFEGQRGELLKVNCLLDEFIRRDTFIRILMSESEFG